MIFVLVEVERNIKTAAAEKYKKSAHKGTFLMANDK